MKPADRATTDFIIADDMYADLPDGSRLLWWVDGLFVV